MMQDRMVWDRVQDEVEAEAERGQRFPDVVAGNV